MLQQFTSVAQLVLVRRNYSQSFRPNRSITSLLREFYLKTHPDMFGSYPEARKVNEHSLKALSQHLEKLQSGRSDHSEAHGVAVRFYLRGKTKDKTTFRVVETVLQNTNVNDNIYHLLRACGYVSHED
jgi:hypothetical protein